MSVAAYFEQHSIGYRHTRRRRILYACVGICLVFDAGSAQSNFWTKWPNAPDAADRTNGSFLTESPFPTLPNVSLNNMPITIQAPAGGPQESVRTFHTGRFDNFIDPQEIAPKLSSSDKVGMGLKGAIPIFPDWLGWLGHVF